MNICAPITVLAKISMREFSHFPKVGSDEISTLNSLGDFIRISRSLVSVYFVSVIQSVYSSRDVIITVKRLNWFFLITNCFFSN